VDRLSDEVELREVASVSPEFASDDKVKEKDAFEGEVVDDILRLDCKHCLRTRHDSTTWCS
jgi:hypothetical protein